MAINSRSIGNIGEDIATKFLQEKGFHVIERNYCIYGGEIDIVAQYQGLIIFIEVRYRSTLSHGHPLETIGKQKLRLLKRTIIHYCNKKQVSLDVIRVDCISVVPTGTTYDITHLEGISLE